MAVKHLNNGSCPKCMMILNHLGGTYQPLRKWFEEFQSRHPEAHASCGARGEVEQNFLYEQRRSKAKYGKSAHNYGAALDIFEMTGTSSDIYEAHWFKEVLKPELPDWITWYGEPGSSFFELPHVEVKNWRDLVAMGELKLKRAA